MAQVGGDALRDLNQEIRMSGHQAEGKVSPDGTPWLALESNPDVLNEFAAKIGLAPGIAFVDVLVPEVLMLPPHKELLAMILLFPCSDRMYKARRAERDVLSKLPQYANLPSEVFFLKQLSQFGNACGTIACLHALTNATDVLLEGSALATYRARTKRDTPHNRGLRLSSDAGLKASSDAASHSRGAQTAVPARSGPDLDHHFVAFVPVGGRLWELDGTKFAPIDHGETTTGPSGSFASDALQLATRFMRIDPDSLEFSLCALIRL